MCWAWCPNSPADRPAWGPLTAEVRLWGSGFSHGEDQNAERCLVLGSPLPPPPFLLLLLLLLLIPSGLTSFLKTTHTHTPLQPSHVC